MRYGSKTAAITLALCLAAPVTTLFFTGSAGAGAASCFEGDSTNRGFMRGDLDGDGTRDGAWIFACRRDRRCRYFVKVQLATTTDRQRLHAPRFVLRNYSRIAAMVKVDLAPGKEFGVVLGQGASTTLMGLYTIRGAEIRRVRVEGAGAPTGDLFAYGGSIGYQSGNDCARNRPPGQVILSEATINDTGTRYRVRRRWFAASGTSLVRTAEPTQRESVRVQNLYERFYEFRNNPFGSCPGRVRG